MTVEAMNWAASLLPHLDEMGRRAKLPDVPPSARLLLVMISWRELPGGGTRVLRFKKLARETGLNVKTVRRGLAWLEAVGIWRSEAVQGRLMVGAGPVAGPGAEAGGPATGPQGSRDGTPKGPATGPHKDKDLRQARVPRGKSPISSIAKRPAGPASPTSSAGDRIAPEVPGPGAECEVPDVASLSAFQRSRILSDQSCVVPGGVIRPGSPGMAALREALRSGFAVERSRL